MPNGHWADSLLLVAEAASGKFKTTVVGSRIPPDWLCVRLDRLEVDTYTPKPTSFTDSVLYFCIALVRWLGIVGRSFAPSSRFIQDLRLLGTAFHEAFLLRATTTRASAQAVDLRFLMSGGGAFLGLVQKLVRVPHVRVIHDPEIPTTGFGRCINNFWRNEHWQVLALCPTAAVESELCDGGFSGTTHVGPFAMRSSGQYISEEERHAARKYFGIPINGTALCLVGGWWAEKDIGTVAHALQLITSRLHIIIAGHPLHEPLLQEMMKASSCRFTVLRRGLGSQELRRVYAAADASIVSRWRGVNKESGLVMDAVRFGVPLVLSDHDDSLCEQVRHVAWVLVYGAQDAGGLAKALDNVARNPLSRPPESAAKDLGLRRPDEVLKDLWMWALTLGASQ